MGLLLNFFLMLFYVLSATPHMSSLRSVPHGQMREMFSVPVNEPPSLPPCRLGSPRVASSSGLSSSRTSNGRPQPLVCTGSSEARRTLHVAARPSSPPRCREREEGGPEAQAGGTRARGPGSEPAGSTALIRQASSLPLRVIERNPLRDAPRPERTCRLSQ